jgi:hypothetical protein
LYLKEYLTMRRFWIWRSYTTATQQIGSRAITPVVQSVGLRWPGGGWLWQFPLAVEIVDEDEGTQQRLPIPDLTRSVVWFLYALALIVIFATTLFLWSRRRRALQAKKVK